MKIDRSEGRLIITDFNEFDAYRIASKIEEDGIGFYIYLASKATNPEMKNLFEFLIRQEQEHLKFFKDGLFAIGQAKHDIHTQKIDELLILLDFGIFPPMMKALKADYNEKDAIQFGIDVENKTIVFYEACLKHVTSPDVKKELLNIINEEKKHKELFESIRGKI